MECELEDMLTSGCEDHPLRKYATSRIKRSHDYAFEKQNLEHGGNASSHRTQKLKNEENASSFDITESEHHAARRSSRSIAETIGFMDALSNNPIFFQALSKREIMMTKFVCRAWRELCANIITNISRARRNDEGRDWYFPIFSTVDRDLRSAQASRLLQGMWHDSREFSSTSMLRKLPPVDYLPPPTFQSVHNCICQVNQSKVEYAIVASSGGLLLLQTVTALKWQKGSRFISNNHNFRCGYENYSWPTLKVTNPLTRQLQVLPIFKNRLRRAWQHRPQFLLMVDEIANSYKVLLYLGLKTPRFPSEQLVVYDSKSMRWKNVDLVHPPIHPPFGCWTEPIQCRGIGIYSTLCTRGRFYLSDIRKSTATDFVAGHAGSGVVRLFNVDIETGQHILQSELAMYKSHQQAVQAEEFRDLPLNASSMFRNLELVECMGHLYAVIPARLDEFLYDVNAVRQNMWVNVNTMASTYMPLQFYIFQLEGDVGVEGHGVLRIRHPIARRNCQQLGRRRSLVSTMSWSKASQDGFGRAWPERNWFACTCRGSVIWVTVADYLLQYNVLTGESYTEMLPTNVQIEGTEHMRMEKSVGVAYRASFHMQP